MNSSIFPGQVPKHETQPSRLLPTVLKSESLFMNQREIVIRHDGQDYFLRITRQNKLILTK